MEKNGTREKSISDLKKHVAWESPMLPRNHCSEIRSRTRVNRKQLARCESAHLSGAVLMRERERVR